MPLYEYSHCGDFERFVRNFDDRDRVSCSCGALATRKVSRFSIGNQTYVANNLSNIEFGTGVKGIETVKDADRAMQETGTIRCEPYYRPPKPPPPKEVTLEELAPYLDGMPLNNQPVGLE